MRVRVVRKHVDRTCAYGKENMLGSNDTFRDRLGYYHQRPDQEDRVQNKRHGHRTAKLSRYLFIVVLNSFLERDVEIVLIVAHGHGRIVIFLTHLIYTRYFYYARNTPRPGT